MAEKETFGYDPLAWLREGSDGPDEQPEASAAEETTAAADAEPGAESGSPVEVQQSAKEPPAGPQPTGPLALPEVLHVSEAQALKARLSALVDADEVALDGAAVERADGASLQLLCAFVRDVRERGASVRWQAVSDGLTASATALGIEKELFG